MYIIFIRTHQTRTMCENTGKLYYQYANHYKLKSEPIAEPSVLEPEAPVVELVIAVGAVPLVVALPDVGDAEPAPASELSARARQAVHSLVCNR